MLKRRRERERERARWTKAVCTLGVNAICSTPLKMEAFIRERSACLCLPALCLVIVWPRLFLFPLFLFSLPPRLLLLLTLSCFVYYYPCSSIFPLNPKFQLNLLDLIDLITWVFKLFDYFSFTNIVF